VYAADLRTGVYRSDDGGKLWVQIDKGLTMRAVKALTISSDGGTLYAATEGGGVFRLDIRPDAATTVSSVSAASFAVGAALAPESIASGFGKDLTAATQTANGAPLPTALGGVSVSVTDSAGIDRPAPLFFVSAARSTSRSGWHRGRTGDGQSAAAKPGGGARFGECRRGRAGAVHCQCRRQGRARRAGAARGRQRRAEPARCVSLRHCGGQLRACAHRSGRGHGFR